MTLDEAIVEIIRFNDIFEKEKVSKPKILPPKRDGSVKYTPLEKSVSQVSIKPTWGELKEIYTALNEVLTAPILDQNAFKIIAENYSAFFLRNSNIMFDALQDVMLARTTDEQFAELMLTKSLSKEHIKIITKNRAVWKGITELELSFDSTSSSPKKSSKERWSAIRKLLIGKDKNGFLVSGRFVEQREWFETQPDSKGDHYRSDTANELLDTWKKSKIDMTFQDWAVAVGALDAKDLIEYYNAEQRSQLEVLIKDGVLKNTKGIIIDTSDARQPNKNFRNYGYVDFVLGLDDKLYCYDTKDAEYVKGAGGKRHSGFLAAGPVKYAGEIRIIDGKIKAISTASGHYRPTEKHVYDFLQYLNKQKIDLNGIEIYNFGENTISSDAAEWFRTYKLGIKQVQLTKPVVAKKTPPPRPVPKRPPQEDKSTEEKAPY